MLLPGNLPALGSRDVHITLVIAFSEVIGGSSADKTDTNDYAVKHIAKASLPQYTIDLI